ncbi:uncharacterized protein cubi_01443 [Cryptosporidium ubiquitum]|uniref:Uncharacterized protein n=1 Tax=Cryptosporidium ubiquitum TaxID=857276 RepID=A0A1J4MD13_9CRYT|nr:uncharacterized protein cubi_01443 [Cryptosporidium ubiquitum]OII72110.1 hypothetical protein cubi_01443 [Cryptosporidium ubiquitum]
MDSNLVKEKKNVDNNLANSHLSKCGSSINGSVEHQESNKEDEFHTKNMIISDTESNFSCKSNFSENVDNKCIVSVEKTKICIPLSIETKNTNAFLLTKNENSKAFKNQTELKLKNDSEVLLKGGKKKLNKNKNYNGKKKIKNVRFEKKKKRNRKFSICCCFKTEAVDKKVTENKTSKSRDIMQGKPKNTILGGPPKQKTSEEKLKDAEEKHKNEEGHRNSEEKLKNTENNKVCKIRSKTGFIEKSLDETKPNINIKNPKIKNPKIKSPKSKSLENIYKIFEYNVNIEIPKFNNSMDLWFLSKRFEEKEMSQKNPMPTKLPNFNEKEITDIISDTLSWYEIHKLNKIRKLENMLSD